MQINAVKKLKILGRQVFNDFYHSSHSSNDIHTIALQFYDASQSGGNQTLPRRFSSKFG
jgi:hypothetical protein